MRAFLKRSCGAALCCLLCCFIMMSMLETLAATTTAQTPQKRMKVILDTDIGTDIDDAWALAFILANENFETLGVTVTDANTPARARVACKMLHVTKLDAIPVAVGRETPTPADRIDYQFGWAEDFTAKRPIKQSAADFIVETVKRHPGEVTLIAVGPLQNIADALRKEPRLGQYVKRVVLMSGCIYGTADRQTPIPEWNVVSATKDAQLVYAAGLPLTIVPLDSTTHVQLQDAERGQLTRYHSPLTNSIESLYRLWLASPRQRMTLHDQLAVVEAVSPETFFGKRETLKLYVDDQGYTRIDEQKGQPVIACLEPKRDAFMNFYLSYLTKQRLGM